MFIAVQSLRFHVQAAISAYSSLVGLEDKDVELFKKHFLSNTTQSFLIFRRCA